jgi:four helix bundle protein
VSKLTDANAEQMETQHCVSEALDCGYLSAADATQLNSGLEEIGRMFNSMMDKANSFCSSPGGVFREAAIEYFTNV